jgi:hypothetical protein
VKVCLGADTVDYLEGGGHFWVYLNWALGLRAAGCDVVWLEPASRPDRVDAVRRAVGRFGIAAFSTDEPEGVLDADLLVSLSYRLGDELVSSFRRSALVDIDPGLLQLWLGNGDFELAPFDVRFTTSPVLARDGWLATSPCAALEAWEPVPAEAGAAFTTVTHWWADEWLIADDGTPSRNDKRTGFLDYLDLPAATGAPLELALQGADDDELEDLASRGWRLRDALAVAATPEAYRAYLGGALGEFSCAKPSCVLLRNGWVSDRSVCFLASGKPVVVQDTGPTPLLPHGEGVWRFRDPDEAAACLDRVLEEYDAQCRLARELAEERFDAARVAASVVERAL